MASNVRPEVDATPRPIPGLSKLGAAVLVFGLLYDVVQHGMGQPAAAGGFTVGEHSAHLLAFVGMVLVIVGVIAQGVRAGDRDQGEGDH